ncbi:MAG: serine hydrolase [Betaproteobacteria bacterium]|nr:serine hydrolase [Betaproteobacteria bacterium]
MQTHSGALQKKLARRIEQFCRADEPGIAVGAARGGKTVFTGGHGLASLESRAPFTPTSAFRICSISKQFLCALIWKAQCAAKLDVTAHPSRYVSGFAGLDRSLTIAHLMQNRSGLRDHWVLAMWMGARAEQPFTLADGEEVIRRAPKSMFAPGSQNLYCNGNFVLLERALENVTGRSFIENIHQDIFDPLGMSATFVGVDCSDALPGGEQGYRSHNGRWEIEQNGMHWSGPAGMVSTIEDMLKWDACLNDPKRAGLPFVADITRLSPFNDGAGGLYASGIGVIESDHAGRRLVTHTGALRGWRSVQLRHESEGVSVYVFINRTASPKDVATDVAKIMGAAPIWDGGTRKRARIADLPHRGTYVNVEQGMVVALGPETEGKPAASLTQFGDAAPLFHAASGAFETEDRRTSIRFLSDGHLLLTALDHNVTAVLERVEENKRPFAARGVFSCAPLGSAATIESRGEPTSIAFDGVFGKGIHYPLHALNERLAWFDIPRGVDESPPGRVLVVFDKRAGTLELSCGLARRVVFRK